MLVVTEWIEVCMQRRGGELRFGSKYIRINMIPQEDTHHFTSFLDSRANIHEQFASRQQLQLHLWVESDWMRSLSVLQRVAGLGPRLQSGMQREMYLSIARVQAQPCGTATAPPPWVKSSSRYRCYKKWCVPKVKIKYINERSSKVLIEKCAGKLIHSKSFCSVF